MRRLRTTKGEPPGYFDPPDDEPEEETQDREPEERPEPTPAQCDEAAAEWENWRRRNE